jgi:hypothetical protein
MRPVLFITAALIAGCATGRILVTGHRDAVRFDFDRASQPVVVGGIEVFEFEQGRRGQTVCELKPPSRRAADFIAMRNWVYGQAVSRYTTSGCPSLARGRRYGAHVFHSSHCILSIDFTLLADGTVRALGRGDDGCYM